MTDLSVKEQWIRDRLQEAEAMSEDELRMALAEAQWRLMTVRNQVVEMGETPEG